ncbi:7tm Odorant receptor [Popillia japonica]|uniref:7tm Odorant receptor n=1 Tax=Popillia japonica TaxID=7064 RepID=A0AAW1MKP5_POPJA
MQRVYSLTLLFHYFVTLLTGCNDLYELLIRKADISYMIVMIISLMFIYAQFGYYAVPADIVASEISDLSNSIYMSEWYKNSVGVQKQLLFMMVRSQRRQYFMGAGMIEINIYAYGSQHFSHFNTHFNEDEYIIGDKAYPTLNWCIPPFIERGRLTPEQIRFNAIHAKTRQVIERAFALLFGRFRRLRYVDMNRVDLIPSTIIAACTLHNVCLVRPDALLAEYVEEGLAVGNNPDNVDNEHGLQDGNARRNYLLDIINN